MRCFLCKKNNFKLVYKLKTKNILCCKNDGLVLAKAHKSEKLYGKSYFDNPPFSNFLNRFYFLNKLATIKLATSNQKPKILDVGCGWGDFEEVLEKEKIPYLGIDVNKEAIEICRKKGLNCHQLSLEKLLNSNHQLTRNKQNSNYKYSNSKKFDPLKIGNWNLFGKLVNWNLEFDCITLFQVIEHVKNPLPLLISAKKLLKKNGIILITTPNHDSPLRKIFGPNWSIYHESSHFVFYNKKTLKQTLELAGFKNTQIKLDQMRFLSLKYILNRLTQVYPSSIFHLLASNFHHLKSNIPLPTDPFGDLEATAFMNYD